MKKDLTKIKNIQAPCMNCKNEEDKYCHMCPYWQFANLAYFKLKMDPMNSIAKILKD